MKKAFPLLIFSLAYFTSFGQLEWVFDNYIPNDYVHDFLKTKKKQYVLLHGDDDYCCPKMLTVLDSVGNVLFDFNGSGVGDGHEISCCKMILPFSRILPVIF